ncbi:unnamed protein product, partial [Linum tenue]
ENEITNAESLQFDLATIEAATSNYDPRNKLGQGGFGEVYRGTLITGEEIAVKRLSKSSGQGEEEFKNEVLLVAKLQHKNLVRLLGFCLEGDERILVYEFVPNKSLDHFLGYMSPEYAMYGQFSEKSDVYSFGVLLLEIITGLKNSTFTKKDGAQDLLGYVWKNWKDGTPLEVLDATLLDSYSYNEVLRCIHVGLLCVQEHAADRPTMATVALMLSGYSVSQPLLPKQPAFGTLTTGEEIAVKRLSKSSGQGEEEFKNEVLLVAKLQHRNLVKLLGFCLEGDERILVYEFVPNKSLDHFLGYMSPEYAMYGQFSAKSDVYSFGVLLLEIITGLRNSTFTKKDGAQDLLGYVWRNWRDGTPLEVLDATLLDSCSTNEVMRCIYIGLLCVQENPADRPTMAAVVLMLSGYSVSHLLPKQPAFFSPTRATGGGGRRTELMVLADQSDHSGSKSVLWSIDEASITDIYPR